jgi:hypothetical protein
MNHQIPNLGIPYAALSQPSVSWHDDEQNKKLCIKLRRASEASRETNEQHSALLLDAYNALFQRLTPAAQQWILGYFEGAKDKARE